MKDIRLAKLDQLFFNDHPKLLSQRKNIMDVCNALISVYKNGNKVLICGNGGSAADSEHIVGELMKGFMLKRPLPQELKDKFDDKDIADKLQQGLPAIALTVHSSLITAFANDVDPSLVFAQQVLGYGKSGDLLLGISTSGNADNVVKAFKTANALGVATVGLTGRDGGTFKNICNHTVIAPDNETYKIQEYHIQIYHFICIYLEAYFFES